MKMKIADLNHDLITKLQDAGFDAICEDYFRVAYRIEKPVLMTASNPNWTFGGGIDALFHHHFPKLVELKQMRGGEQERIANICFCITVDNMLHATQETIKKALAFAVANTGKDETLLVSGIGTGIGRLSVDDFIEVLKEVT